MGSSIVWALATVSIVVFVCVYFKKPIASLISRAEGVNYGRFQIKTPSKVDQAEGSSPDDAAEELLRAFDNVLLRQQEAAITTDLGSRGLPYDTDTARVLIRHLAGTQLALALERIFHQIFGSQIMLLQLLNTTSEPIPETSAKIVYDNAALQYADSYKEFSFGEWLDFLRRVELITVQDSHIRITPMGEEFLAYFKKQGRLGGKVL